MKLHKRKIHANHERWLVSYADFITLMFAFFVVLYASSQTDISKQAQVAHAINQAFKSLGLFPPDKADPARKALPPLPTSRSLRSILCWATNFLPRRQQL